MVAPAGPSTAKPSHGRKTELCLAAALIAYAVVRFAPPLAGLNVASQTVLGVVLVGMILWISEAVPLEIPASDHTRRYLKTKKDKLGHRLSSL